MHRVRIITTRVVPLVLLTALTSAGLAAAPSPTAQAAATAQAAPTATALHTTPIPTTAPTTTPVTTAAAESAGTGPAAKVRPVVTSVLPTRGPAAGGTRVTITGTGLTGATKVAFGQATGTSITVTSDTQLTITTPAATQPGTVDVKVTTPSGPSAVTTTDQYTYTATPPAPAVTGLSPTTGPTTGGNTLTLTGTNLTGATQVTFAGIAGTNLTMVSATTLTVTTPAHPAGVVDAVVTTPAGTSTTTPADQYTYTTPASAPTVTGLSPTSGPTAGGTTVTLTGTGFTGATRAIFGKNTAPNLTVTSDTLLTVTAPTATKTGTVTVAVTTPAGTSATGPAAKYTYTAPAPAPPTITGLTPATGPTYGGTQVTVSGTNLAGATQVLFGTTTGTNLTVTSPTSLTVTAPAHTAGAIDVTVTTPAGTSTATAFDQYTYTPAAAGPTITGITPAAGPTKGGTKVTVTGTGFTATTQVRFGSTPGTKLTGTSGTKLQITSPATTTGGAVDITITTPAGTSPVTAADQYTYTVPTTNHCGTITTNQTWTPTTIHLLNCAVTVPAGKTLTIASGTIVKATAGSQLILDGTLVASGTASSPVVFTSYNDDTVGGDTNGDGATTTPAPGDWGGIGLAAGSVVTLDHTIDRYTYGLTGNPGSLALTSSTLWGGLRVFADNSLTVTGDTIHGGTVDAGLSGDTVSPVVQNNTVDNPPGDSALREPPFSVVSSDLDLTKLTGNTAPGATNYGFSLGGTLAHNTTWPTTSMPLILGGVSYATQYRRSLDVPSGVTLTLPAGTIVKSTSTSDPTLLVQGTLVASGTASSPVVFTSYNDDTVGGDTNGDGATTTPAPGDWGGIGLAAGSVVTLDHTIDRYTYGLTGNPGSLALTSSTLWGGLRVFADNSLTVTGDTIHGGTVDAGLSGDTVSPVVQNNTVDNPPGDSALREPPFSVVSSDLDLTKLTGNTAPGATNYGFSLGGTLAHNTTWPTTSMPLILGGVSYATQYRRSLDVPSGVTLTLPAGTIVKSTSTSDPTLLVQGTLVASGTASSPVVFTSYNDDTVGGDTNGDGATTTPAPGDWGGIGLAAGSVVTLDHTIDRYTYGLTGNPGSLALTSSTLWGGLRVFADNSLTVTGDTIHGGTVDAGLSGDTVSPVVQNNTVDNPPGDSALREPPFSVVSSDLDLTKLTGNTAPGATNYGFSLGGTLAHNTTWPTTSMPLILGGVSYATQYRRSLDVPSGVTLTLPAGTIVKSTSTSDPTLLVQGTLVASGTASSPVVFTSYNDDTVGGDTNGDGATTTPAPGDWGGIGLAAGSVVTLDHTIDRYTYGLTGNPGSLALTSSTLWGGLRVFADNSLTVTGDTIHGGTVDAGLSGDTVSPVVQNNTVDNPPGDSALREPPFSVVSSDLDLTKLTGNTAPGATNYGFSLGGTLAHNTTWPTTSMPLILGGVSYATQYRRSLDVPSGVTLTLPAGTIVKSTSTSDPTLLVQGTLVASGTASSPVVFTSYNDDTVGGDTNGDGATTTPAPGDWGGIQANGAAAVQMGWTKISFGQEGLTGTIAGALNLDHDTWAALRDTAIRVDAGSAAVTNNTISGANAAGIQLGTDGPAVVTKNRVTHGDGSGIAVTWSDSAQVSRNTVTTTGSTDYPAFRVSSSHLDMNALNNNTASGNTSLRGFYIDGTLTTSYTAAPTSLDWMLGSSCTPLTVAPGVTLTLNAGTVIKEPPGNYNNCGGGHDPALVVQGTLAANGTSSNPVVFTSISDDTVGGDTNGDGATTTPAPGHWGGISLAAPAGDTKFNGVVVRYATTAISVGYLTALEVDNTEFAYNDAALEVSGTADNDPVLGALDCIPPYTSFVTGTGDWYGTEGGPGADIDLAAFIGLDIPGDYSSLYGAASSMYSLDAGLGDNTIPWTLYGCPEVDVPPFPVTPVLTAVADAPPFPGYAETDTNADAQPGY